MSKPFQFNGGKYRVVGTLFKVANFDTIKEAKYFVTVQQEFYPGSDARLWTVDDQNALKERVAQGLNSNL